MDWEAFYNSFRRPDFIPGFEIENRLGGGAFGDVYRARKSSIGRPYAIKFLKVEDDDQRTVVERELGQVRHFAAIDHPNLVTIEDIGVAMGVPYVIMGYAGDETLARRLRAGELTVREALEVFTKTARGVHALHERNLVHFDLKPSNVFLDGDDARVGDYGLSKLLDGGRMTLSYGRGTPMYMAPEILRSRADHRADLYSLGVILFESLAGRVPFQPDEIGGLVLREEDAPPEFPAGFPDAARRACEACLRLSPDDRVGTVVELLALLGQSPHPTDTVRFSLPQTVLDRPIPPAASRRPSNAGPRGNTRTPLGEAGLLEGGFKVSPEGQGSTSRETPGARAMELVAELRARREAGEVPAGRASVAMVPVPPRIAGGLGSTLYQTTRVGFDVFVESIIGVVASIAGAFKWITDRLVRQRSGGAVGRAVRFALFLLVMAGVGFGATLLGLFVLFLTSSNG